MKPYEGPTRFSSEYRSQEIDRLALEVKRIAADTSAEIGAAKMGPLLAGDIVALRFGEANRLVPRAPGLTAQMPRATAADGGRPLDVIVTSAAAGVTFVPVGGALINGATSLAPGAAAGLIRFLWDGKGWWA